jgi:putative oxidoreductase
VRPAEPALGRRLPVTLHRLTAPNLLSKALLVTDPHLQFGFRGMSGRRQLYRPLPSTPAHSNFFQKFKAILRSRSEVSCMQQSSAIHPAMEKITSSVPVYSPDRFDWGLLCLRVWFGMSLFLKHGWEKPTNFARMSQHFPNPLHIGAVPSLVFALISDAICSILVVLGLGTRWAALLVFINIFVAWSFVHHFQFFGRGADHEEAVVLYLGAFLALAIIGPGRISLDYLWKIGKFAKKHSVSVP